MEKGGLSIRFFLIIKYYIYIYIHIEILIVQVSFFMGGKWVVSLSLMITLGASVWFLMRVLPF
jgi:hypothetical protein